MFLSTVVDGLSTLQLSMLMTYFSPLYTTLILLVLSLNIFDGFICWKVLCCGDVKALMPLFLRLSVTVTEIRAPVTHEY